MRCRNKVYTIILTVSLIVSSLSLNLNASAATYAMSLNTRYSGKISSSSQVDYFNFKPSETGIYTVETFGSLDTEITFQQYSWSTLKDDDSGVGLNAKIGFSVTNASNNCQFQVRGHGGKTGSYTIQVRKQKMAIFTGKYSDINTQADASTPSTQMSNDGYRVSTFLNATRAQVLANDNTGAQEINSEIVFFSGHGNTDRIAFQNNTTLLSGDIPSLDRTKVAVWAGCQTGGGTNSFAQRARTRGAIVSIGWTTNTTVGSSKTFTNTFFTELKNDRTVQEACKTAAGKLLWPWDGAKNYVIFGPTDYVLLSQVTWKTAAANQIDSNTSKQQFLDDQKRYEYYIDQISDGCTRYIKMFNGRLTNDYYDVYDNGAIVKSDNTITSNDISNVQQLVSTSARQSLSITPEKEGYTIIDTEVHNVYVRYNGEVIPVKIIGTTYQDSLGCNLLEYNCVNEITGASINYDDISFAS